MGCGDEIRSERGRIMHGERRRRKYGEIGERKRRTCQGSSKYEEEWSGGTRISRNAQRSGSGTRVGWPMPWSGRWMPRSVTTKLDQVKVTCTPSDANRCQNRKYPLFPHLLPSPRPPP